jgi:Ca2+-binding EF-hand superfamily protein
MYLQRTLRLIDSTEKEINEKRKEIYEMSKLFMGKVFNRMDMNGKGYITPRDIGMFMKSNSEIIMTNESDLLFIRLDKDRDGKVTLGDLMKEVVPAITVQR